MKKYYTTMATLAVITTMAGCATPSRGVMNTEGSVMPASDTLATQVPAATSVASPGIIAQTAPVAGQAGDLVGTLVQQLGITPAQATGGAGSIFSVAKQSLSPSSFLQLSQAIPDISQYLSAAPSLSASSTGNSALMNAAGSALGGSGSALNNMLAMTGAFQSLGLNSSMMSMFIPIVLQYVQTQGGSTTMALLQSIFPH